MPVDNLSWCREARITKHTGDQAVLMELSPYLYQYPCNKTACELGRGTETEEPEPEYSMLGTCLLP